MCFCSDNVCLVSDICALDRNGFLDVSWAHCVFTIAQWHVGKTHGFMQQVQMRLIWTEHCLKAMMKETSIRHGLILILSKLSSYLKKLEAKWAYGAITGSGAADSWGRSDVGESSMTQGFCWHGLSHSAKFVCLSLACKTWNLWLWPLLRRN